MADTTARLKIQSIVDLKGFEEASGALKKLGQSAQLSDKDLRAAKQGILEFAGATKNSEQVIGHAINALKGLQSQADLCSDTYKEYGSEIKRLEMILRGTTPEIEAQRQKILETAKASDQSAAAIRRNIEALTALRKGTRPDSSGFNALSKDIAQAQERLEQLASAAQRVSRGMTTIPASSFQKLDTQIAGVIEGLQNASIATDDFLQRQERLSLLVARRTTLSGRQQVRADALMYDSPQYANYVTGAAARLDLPGTTAGYQQRIQEINQELANVTGYERRRSLTLELINLNRQLKQAVVEVVTSEQLAVMAARQRLNAAREVMSRSGFGAFSSDVRARAADGAYDTGTQKAIRKAHNRIIDENAIAGVDGLLDVATAGTERYLKALEDRKIAAADAEAKNAAYLESVKDRLAEEALRRDDARHKAEVEQFMARLNRNDMLVRKQAEVKSQLGLGGRELSPFYQGVVDIGSSRAAGNQSRMGKLPQEALADIINTFNADLNRAVDGTQRADQRLREAAVKAAGGSKEVAAAFEQYQLGKTPVGMFPQAQEGRDAYVSRIRSEYGNLQLPDFKNLRKGTINELEQVRASLRSLRGDLDPLSASFEAAEKRIVTSIRKIDRELERRSGRSRVSTQDLVQASGAVISGGIFGGPEGFLGGLAGAAGGALTGMGLTGGAFAGAAIGAQLGSMRQSIGQMAEYAASIQKQQIALRGVAASQEEYNQAIAAATSATKELNVPQEAAIGGMTKLLAAVKGAGGGVNDAQVAFTNITSAIKATGGGAEEVNGAITALTQIFSKGKVSAEEINQIAERLPGTFNMIAQASGRTGPELAKALQKGEVGLNDLMKFIVQLGDKYGETAKKMAGSSQDAGARLTIAFNDMRMAVGKALQPIGAELQAAFADFIKNITPSAIAAAKAVGAGLKSIKDNAAAIGELVKFAAAFAGVNLAINAFVGLRAALAAAFAQLQIQLVATSGAATGAQVSMGRLTAAVTGLAAAMSRLAAIGVITLGIKFLGDANAIGASIESLRKRLEGGGTGASFDKAQKSREEILQAQEVARKTVQAAQKELAGMKLNPVLSLIPGAGAIQSAAMGSRAQVLNGRILDAQTTLRLDPLSYRTRAEMERDKIKGLTDFALPDPEGGGKEKKGPKPPEDRTAQLREDLEAIKGISASENLYRDLLYEGREILAEDVLLSKQLYDIERDKNKALLNANYESEKQVILEIAQARALDAQLKTEDKIREIKTRKFAEELQNQQAIRDSVKAYTDLYVARELDAQYGRTYLRLVTEGILPAEAERIAGFERSIALQKEELDTQIRITEESMAAAQADGLATKALSDKLALLRGQRDAVEEAGRNGPPSGKTKRERLDGEIAVMRGELNNLIDPINNVVEGARNIGQAFSSAFSEVITGSKSVSEALGNAFESIAKGFAEMAAQILAQQLVLTLVQSIGGLFAPAASAMGTGATPAIPASPPAPRAGGGPVFASRPYIVGEQGPELFVPSGNGTIIPNNKLGTSNVPFQRSGDPTEGDPGSAAPSSRSRLGVADIPFTKTSRELMVERREKETLMALQNPGPLDVRFESQIINGVEYVTAEQHRQGMAQAAERGRAMTLSTLQNSVKARRQVGMY